MINKKHLFENIRDYSPQEIADAIRSGTVTMYELKKHTQGQFTPMMQLEVKGILNGNGSASTTDEPQVEPTTPSAPLNTESPQSTIEPEPVEQTFAIGQSSVSSPVEPVLLQNENPVENYSIPEESKQPKSTITEKYEPQMIDFSTTTQDNFIKTEPTPPVVTPQIELSEPVKKCPCCGALIPVQCNFCKYCGTSMVNGEKNTPPSFESEPAILKKFSWGAFSFVWIWGIANRVFWSFLAFIPFAGFPVSIVLGIKGHRSAWESKEWKSKEEFIRVQRGWNVAGIIVFILSLFISVISIAVLCLEFS